MATSVSYRLRIRDVGDTTDALVLTSVRGGTNPVVEQPPSGDGQELDPVASTVRTGQYTMRFVDPVIVGSSPPSRVVTSQLFDSGGRQLLLSRRCYIEISNDGGSTWPTVLVPGYVMGYRLPTAITWEFTVGDTRRIENTKQVFDGTSTTFAQRGCLFGGPINGGAWGPIPDRGGWKFKVIGVNAPIGGQFSGNVLYGFVSGYKGINDPVTTRYTDMVNGAAQSVVAMANQAVQSYYAPSVPQSLPSFGYYGGVAPGWGSSGFPGVTLRIKEFLGASNNGLFVAGCVTSPGNGLLPEILIADPGLGASFAMYALWPPGVSLPTVGDIHTISCFTAVPTDSSPVYLDLHPVDIATGLYTDAGIPYDATAAANLKTLMGSTMRVAMRVTESQTLLDFLENALFGPFGFASRVSGTGVAQLFATRLKLAATPTTTIGTNDLKDASGVIFDNDEQSVVSIVRFRSKIFWAYNPNTQTDQSSRPLDSVLDSDSETRVVNSDPNVAYSTQEVVYEIPGMIHDVSGIAQDMNAFTSAIALELFDRFGRGGPVCDALAVLAASDTGFQIGDEIYVDPAHFPNLSYRFGDNPSVGARIMQVLRRTETPTGPLVKVIDAGSAQQPVTPTPTISIAANAGTPRSVAQFTITNAAAINTAASLVVAVQWATGGSSPTNGVDFARYAAGACPTAAIQLPPVAPGSTVWARARTETPGLRPSAWTSWVGVTLSAVGVPTGLTFSPVYQNAAQFNWTNANATDAIDLYVYQGASTPADWTPYFVCTLQPGSTSCLVRNLLGPSIQYQGAVFHRDPLTAKIGAVLTGTFTTNSTSIGVSPQPLGLEILPTTQDASLKTGVVLALYPADPVYDFVIQRAPDVSGSPGTFATIAQVGGDTAIFIDLLPKDGVTRWYQIAHILAGNTVSTYVPALSAIPGGVATGYARPTFVLPQMGLQLDQTSRTANTVTFTVTATDPLNILTSCTVTPSYAGLTSLIDNVTGLPAVAYTATLGVARSFTATLDAAFRGEGFAKFSTSSTGRYPAYVHYTFGQTDQEAAPGAVISILSNNSSTDPTAKALALINAPDNISSIKWLASTSSFPTQVAVATSGASVAGGSPFLIPDLGVSLALGDTVYLTYITIDAFSVVTGLYYQVKATRQNIVAQKTYNFSIAQVVCQTTFNTGTANYGIDGSRPQLDVLPGTSSTSAVFFQLNLLTPDNCTITSYAEDLYELTGGVVGSSLYRAGSGSPIASVSASPTGGWATYTSSGLSEVTTGRTYYTQLILNSLGGVLNNSMACGSVSLTFTSNTTQAVL